MCFGRIYRITNNVTGMSYVGQTTKSIEERFKKHSERPSKSMHISSMIKKYGKNNFTIELIEEANSQDELNYLEVYYVKHFDTMYPKGYNHRAGGEQNCTMSQATKDKISKTKLGVPLLKRRGELRSEEQRIKISRGLGGKAIIGYNQETKETIYLQTLHAGRKLGFNPSNISSVLKNKRPHTKGFVFYYEENSQANQSGSAESNITPHAQRLGIDPADKAD
jgi:group I intron endonuclease